MAVDKSDSGLRFERRRLLVGTNVVLATLLVVALVAVLQWGGYRLEAKADWTSSRVNSLSEGTRALLDGLEQKVWITSAYFETDLEEEDQSKYRQAAADLIELYQTENRSKIEIDYYNPLQDHELREALLERLRSKPKFVEQSARHRELIEGFETDVLPAVTALLDGELQQLGAVSESLGGRSGSVLGQVRMILSSWQQQLPLAGDEIDAAMDAPLPRYGAAVRALTALYRDLAKTLKDIGSVGKELNVQPGRFGPEQQAYLEGAEARFAEVVKTLDAAVESSSDLPRLELEEIAGQLAPNANPIIVETEDDARVVSFADVWPPMDPRMPTASVAFKDRAFRGEERISAAILQMTNPEQTAVVFVRHGGNPLFFGGMMPGQPPAMYAEVKKHLEDLNFTVHEWDLAKQLDPPEIDPAPKRTIYVVLRPTPQPMNPMMQRDQQQPFGEPQRKAILDAIAQSGRALFQAGWQPGQFGTPSPYEYGEYLANDWGIQVDADTVLLRATAIGPGKFRFAGQPIVIAEAQNGEHPIVERLAVMRTLYPLVSPLSLPEESPEGVTQTELVYVERREGLWGVKNLQEYQDQLRNEFVVKMPEDREGSFTIATAAEKEGAKIVVVGARDFCTDEIALSQQMVLTPKGLAVRPGNPGNLTLLVNSLHWLNDNTEIMNLGQPIDVAALEISKGSARSIVGVAVIGVWPLLVAACGGVVWLVRRR